jgi:hypothetical protein
MKHDETQAYAQEISVQCTARKMCPMNTPSITFNRSSGLPRGRFWATAVAALLLCAGAVQAAEPQPPAAKSPLERLNSKPYGSGYEARGLDGRGNDAMLLPPSRTADKDSAAGSQSFGGTSAGSAGGNGGSSSGGGSGGSGGSGSGSGGSGSGSGRGR